MKKGVGCHGHRWRGQRTQVRVGAMPHIFPLPLAGFELGFLPCVYRCLSVELEAGNKCSPVYLPLIPPDHCVHYSLTVAPVAVCVPVSCLASKVSVGPCPHCIACHGPGPRVTPEVLSAMSSAYSDVVVSFHFR